MADINSLIATVGDYGIGNAFAKGQEEGRYKNALAFAAKNYATNPQAAANALLEIGDVRGATSIMENVRQAEKDRLDRQRQGSLDELNRRNIESEIQARQGKDLRAVGDQVVDFSDPNNPRVVFSRPDPFADALGGGGGGQPAGPPSPAMPAPAPGMAAAGAAPLAPVGSQFGPRALAATDFATGKGNLQAGVTGGLPQVGARPPAPVAAAPVAAKTLADLTPQQRRTAMDLIRTGNRTGAEKYVSDILTGGDVEKPPPGFEWDLAAPPGTRRLRAITGGPADKPTEQSARVDLAKGFLADLPDVKATLKKSFGADTGDPFSLDARTRWQLGRGDEGAASRRIQSGQDAITRIMTGAGLNSQEIPNYAARYAPNIYMDDYPTMVSKLNNLEKDLRAVAHIADEAEKSGADPASAVRSYLDSGGAGQQAQGAAPPPPPKVNDVIPYGGKNWQYLGGDPKDPQIIQGSPMSGPWMAYQTKPEEEDGPWSAYATAEVGPTGEAYNQDVARSVLQGVRNIAEGTVALPGNAAMLGAQGMNVLARNVPALGLKEVPQEVLEAAIPGTSADIAGLTTRGLEAVGVSPEHAKPYESQTTMGKVLGTATELAPLGVSVAGIVRRAPGAVAATGGPGASQAGKGIRTVDELRDVKSAAYEAADARSGGLPANNYKFVVRKMEDVAKEEGATEPLHGKALSVLERMKSDIPETPTPGLGAPQGKTLSELERYRQQLSQIARKSSDETQQYMAGQLRDALDEALDTVGQRNPLYREARAANVTYRKAEAIQEVYDRAERAAATSGKPIGEALRQEFKTLANNKRRMRQFGAEEKTRINQIVLGGRTENFLNSLAKSQATGSIPATILGYVTGGIGGAFGGPAISSVMRQGLRTAAAAPTTSRVEALQRLIQKLPVGDPVRRRLELQLTRGRAAAIGTTALPPINNAFGSVSLPSPLPYLPRDRIDLTPDNSGMLGIRG